MMSQAFFTFQDYEKYASAHFVGRPFELITAACWVVVGLGAMWAVFSPKVRDTLLERIALSIISICAFSRSYFVIDSGVVPLDSMMTAVSLALYCMVLWWKHYVYLPKRRLHDFIERRGGTKR